MSDHVLHTSGPWEYGFPIVDGREFREGDCYVSAGGFVIARVSHGGMFPAGPHVSAVREANARLMASAPKLLSENERLRADLKAMEGFAELWYFVSDEAPHEFEKIVSEYSPDRWLGEAHKLMKAKRRA